MKNPTTGKTIDSKKLKGGKLTTAGRLSLKSSDFALPPGPEEKARGIKGRFPIENPAHARNALARVAQSGTPAEQATVRRKVKARYSFIGK